MIIEYIRYRVSSARADALVAAYEEARQSLEASPHCLGFELARCAEAKESFVLRIHWDSLEGHLQGFRKGPHFPAFLRAVQPFLGDIEEMRHYDLTPVRWSREVA
ncbi:Hemoglobin-like protein HbO [Minicystis rosea]|nr:Hemoglobin-like protein HbO [Minicystis rosea]